MAALEPTNPQRGRVSKTFDAESGADQIRKQQEIERRFKDEKDRLAATALQQDMELEREDAKEAFSTNMAEYLARFDFTRPQPPDVGRMINERLQQELDTLDHTKKEIDRFERAGMDQIDAGQTRDISIGPKPEPAQLADQRETREGPKLSAEFNEESRPPLGHKGGSPLSYEFNGEAQPFIAAQYNQKGGKTM